MKATSDKVNQYESKALFPLFCGQYWGPSATAIIKAHTQDHNHIYNKANKRGHVRQSFHFLSKGKRFNPAH